MTHWCNVLHWLWHRLITLLLHRLITLLLPCVMAFTVTTGFGPNLGTIPQCVPKRKRHSSDWLKGNVRSLWTFLCSPLDMVQLNMTAWGRTRVKTRRCTRCKFFKRQPPRLNHRLLCPCTLASQAEHENDAVPTQREAARFDTDSFAVTVDTGAAATMSSFKQDFVGPSTPVKAAVHGHPSASSQQVCKGTVGWNIPDDDGKCHKALIPDSCHVPQGRTRPLSPQHWAQVRKDHHPDPDGTWCGACYNRMVQHWDQQMHKLTPPLHQCHGNTATMHCNAGHSRCHAFCTEIGEGETTEPPIFAEDAHMIPPDDEDECEDQHENVVKETNPTTEDSEEQESPDIPGKEPRPVEFSLDGPDKPSVIIDEDEDEPPKNPTAESL